MTKPRISKRFAAAAAILLTGFLQAWALDPPTREQLERYRADGTLAARSAAARRFGNQRIAPRLVSRMRDRLESRVLQSKTGVLGRTATRIQAPPPGWRGMPTTGTVKVLALLISFADYPAVTPAASFQAQLFGDGLGGFPYESLRNYYRRSSYDKLEIQGDVLGWYQAPYARSTVTETDAGRENLIKEALNYYDQQGHDFSQYDNDGDGAIDYFCVFWTGPHGEWASFWWGYYTGFSDSTYRLDNKRLYQYSWQWELYGYPSGSFSPTTIIHETGHALGVPDYYDYDGSIGPRGGVGGLDMMDANAGDHNCFSKFMLDWITPTVVAAGPQTVVLRASGTYEDALLFMPGATADIFDEYFMVQNRTRLGNDAGLWTGTDGLIVWHVDARLDSWGYSYLYDNSYTEHKLLKLVEADGKENIENGSAATASDYWQAGMTFGPLTTPNTDRYGGLGTGMGIVNIVGAGTPMSVDVFSNDAAPTCAFAGLTEGETVYGTITVDAAAADDNGISRVDLYADAALVGSDGDAPYSFALDTRSLTNGLRTLLLRAYDSILQTATASVRVLVDNIFAPLRPKAVRVLNRGVLIREYINVITWGDNVVNISVTKYRLYLLNGGVRQLLTEVPKAAARADYTYLHRRVSGTLAYTYEIVPVGSQDREGDAGTASVK